MFWVIQPRLGYQILALSFFVYQMKQSILKYIDSPISISKIHSDQPHPGPVLFVCQSDQYDYTKSYRFGYQSMGHLWSGTMIHEDKKYTWKGKYGNLSFDEMTREFFNYNYSQLGIENGKVDRNLFNLNLGMCKQLTDVQYRTIATITSNAKITLLAVDPFTLNSIRINDDPSLVVTVGPSDNGLYDWARVIVEHSVTDYSILDGIECKDYQRIDSSYRQCAIETVQVLLF